MLVASPCGLCLTSSLLSSCSSGSYGSVFVNRLALDAPGGNAPNVESGTTFVRPAVRVGSQEEGLNDRDRPKGMKHGRATAQRRHEEMSQMQPPCDAVFRTGAETDYRHAISR